MARRSGGVAAAPRVYLRCAGRTVAREPWCEHARGSWVGANRERGASGDLRPNPASLSRQPVLRDATSGPCTVASSRSAQEIPKRLAIQTLRSIFSENTPPGHFAGGLGRLANTAERRPATVLAHERLEQQIHGADHRRSQSCRCPVASAPACGPTKPFTTTDSPHRLKHGRGQAITNRQKEWSPPQASGSAACRRVP